MKRTSWNIRGVNGKSKQRLLKNRVIKEKPTILMIQETKCQIDTMKDMASRCWKRCESVATSAEGFLGGMAILWDPVRVVLDQFIETTSTITASFRERGPVEGCTITNVYGPNILANKLEFLERLQNIGTTLEEKPWILGGDFNMITSLSHYFFRGRKRRSILSPHLIWKEA